MQYQVTISLNGTEVGSAREEANSALVAINLVEERYLDQAFPVRMSTGKNTYITARWTGLEFCATQITNH